MRIIGNDPSIPRQAQIVASGTLSTGDAVVVNSDGTVSVVEETSFSQTLGSSVTFESASSYHIGSAFDSNAGKVVVAYRDAGNGERGTAVVGTVSGTSISFGTPEVFNSAQSDEIRVAYDASAQKCVITYVDGGNSSFGVAIVATISGTSISFGSEVVFQSSSAGATAVTYDSDSQKIICLNRTSAVVGTVSGTSISFGTPVAYCSGSSNAFTCIYDPSSQRLVVFFADNNNNYYATYNVGTISGTSISFGGSTNYNSGVLKFPSATYDSNAQKVVFCYGDGTDNNRPYLVAGEVSGSSVTFGTAVRLTNDYGVYATGVSYDASASRIVASMSGLGGNGFEVASLSGTTVSLSGTFTSIDSGRLSYISNSYDDTNNKVIISYSHDNSGEFGKAKVLQPAYTSTNLTTENYIGTAASPAADTQRAKINLKGAVDENQSGLTAGQSYYVQTDGTLGTTPADPSVFAGTAVAANKLIVKG